jgi:ankyrin repeat protein
MPRDSYRLLLWDLQAEGLKDLLASGLAIDVPDQLGDFLLTVACHRLQAESVALLLASGANPNVQNLDLDTPLLCAIDCVEHDPEAALRIVKLLIKHGADLEKRGYMDKTPFLKACSRGNLEMVKLLAVSGACVTAKATDIGGDIGGKEFASIFGASSAMLAYLRSINAA